MLHRCQECLELYVTSNYFYVCNVCGGEQRERLELQKVSNAEGFATIAGWVVHGESVEVKPRWRIA